MSEAPLITEQLSDLFRDWRRNGIKAIERVRETSPATYLRIVSSLLAKDRHLDAADSHPDENPADWSSAS